MKKLVEIVQKVWVGICTKNRAESCRNYEQNRADNLCRIVRCGDVFAEWHPEKCRILHKFCAESCTNFVQNPAESLCRIVHGIGAGFGVKMKSECS